MTELFQGMVSNGASIPTDNISQHGPATTTQAINSSTPSFEASRSDAARLWLARESLQTVGAGNGTDIPVVRRRHLAPETLYPGAKPPTIQKKPRRIWGVKKWSGIILKIVDGLMTVELTPLDHDGSSFQANFELQALSPDEENVRPGDVVYLTTKMIRSSGYGTTVAAELRARRVGVWTNRELVEIERLARERADYFKDATD